MNRVTDRYSIHSSDTHYITFELSASHSSGVVAECTLMTVAILAQGAPPSRERAVSGEIRQSM